MRSRSILIPMVPPPARGWPRAVRARPSGIRGSPARAGMAPSRISMSVMWVGFPRPRGDSPLLYRGPRKGRLVPPPARGWPLHVRLARARQVGSPARAGMAPAGRRPRQAGRGFPRPRGDGAASFDPSAVIMQVLPPARGWPRGAAALWHVGGSPAARGWSRVVVRGIDRLIGSPARAGMAGPNWGECH